MYLFGLTCDIGGPKFDDLLREVGELGPYQKRVVGLVFLPAILIAFEALSVIFIFNIPNHRSAPSGWGPTLAKDTDLVNL